MNVYAYICDKNNKSKRSHDFERKKGEQVHEKDGGKQGRCEIM